MDSQTGRLYPTLIAALAAGVKQDDVVELRGSQKAIRRVARKVRLASRVAFKKKKARQKMAKASRRANR